jgi:hypothetical protein
MQTLNKRRHHQQTKEAGKLEPNGTVVGKGVHLSSFMGRKHYRRTESTYPIRVI